MTVGVSIHTIILPDNSALPIGRTFNFGDEYKALEAAGAVRPATEDEKAAFGAAKAASKTVNKVEQTRSTEDVASKHPSTAKDA